MISYLHTTTFRLSVRWKFYNLTPSLHTTTKQNDGSHLFYDTETDFKTIISTEKTRVIWGYKRSGSGVGVGGPGNGNGGMGGGGGLMTLCYEC